MVDSPASPAEEVAAGANPAKDEAAGANPADDERLKHAQAAIDEGREAARRAALVDPGSDIEDDEPDQRARPASQD